jgi:hypothetical protein
VCEFSILLHKQPKETKTSMTTSGFRKEYGKKKKKKEES